MVTCDFSKVKYCVYIDVSDIQYVINYDFPKVTEDYIHRIGRTGRASKTGTAFTFFTEDNNSAVKELIQILKTSGQEVPEQLYELRTTGKQQGKYR